MQIKLTVKDFAAAIKKEAAAEFKSISTRLEEELVVNTPVDTGKARAGWEVSYTLYGLKATFKNDVDYVKYLNAGSSKQAPAHFIENTVVKYGDPVGTIVTYT